MKLCLRREFFTEKETLLTLLSRDMAWMTLLSGAPGSATGAQPKSWRWVMRTPQDCA